MDSRLEQLKKLILAKKFGQARNVYLSFDNELAKKTNKSVSQRRLNLLNDYCIQLLEKGHNICGSKLFGFMLSFRKETGGLRAFEDIINTICERLPLLSPIGQSEISAIKEHFSTSLENCELNSIESYITTHLEEIDDIASRQEDRNVQHTLKLFGSAICWNIAFRRVNGTAQILIGRAILIFAILMAIAAIYFLNR